MNVQLDTIRQSPLARGYQGCGVYSNSISFALAFAIEVGAKLRPSWGGGGGFARMIVRKPVRRPQGGQWRYPSLAGKYASTCKSVVTEQ